MRNRILAAAIASAIAIPAAQAGEGMWTPQQLPEIAKSLKAAGLKLDAARPASLSRSGLRFG